MQKRHMQQNYALLAVPVLIILGASIGEKVLINKMKKDKMNIPPNENPTSYIPAIQIPVTRDRAVRTDFMPFADFPAPSCRTSGNCSLTFLITASNQSFALGVAEKMFPTVSTKNSSDSASLVLGTEIPLGKTYTVDLAFEFDLYYVQSQCNAKSSIPVDQKQAMCLEGLCLWRNSSSDINDELFKGNAKGNKENIRNEVVAALDFLNSDRDNFNISIWLKKYNDSDNKKGTEQMMASLLPGSGPLIRFPRLMNLASNAYLQYLEGPGTQILFESNKEVPEYDRISTDDLIANLFDMFLPFFYIMVVLYIFPVLLRAIVYEKENKLRMMMKMHGLGDMAYWIVYYAYDFLFSLLYIEVFLLAGKFSGQNFFKANDYSIQLVFFLIYVNWQISLVFLVAAFTSSIKTAQVIGTVVQMLISFLGMFLFQPLVEDVGFSRKMLTLIEIFPGFALYRGIYELQKYAKFCRKGGVGMQWEDLSDSTNGMKEAMIIMCIEWLLILPFAFYIDQVGSAGTGRRKSPLFFLQNSRKKPLSFQQHSINKNSSQSFLQRENDDVAQEREKVECLIKDSSKSHVVVCHNIKKIYPAVDGNPPKAAVKGMSLALPRAECFGMLGPNGAGKTSFISMMIGLTEPTSGAAYVEGLDITTRMDEVYAYMGVCPQHDLLWETLTGVEHLYFYGRLKNLKGPSLNQAVEESLKAVELLSVGDKQAGKYSGGMKRRLSVAISLIGDPKVVYLDEPSTGLDPASRNSLWNVVKHAKKDRAILLTTHSMEEAEALCDRLGIFVDGSLQCVGNSKELKARYGGYFVFTMTTSPNHDVDVEEMVLRLCRDAHKIYHLAGTQKFELPKHQVQLADVFQLVEDAKSRFLVQAWALADTTLEDVFIKVARQAQCFDDHSS